jgi:hypothetical protein
VDWNAAAVGQHLAANVFTNGRGAVQLQQQVGLEQVLAPSDLAVSDGVAEMHPLRLHIEQHFLAVHGVAHPVQAPQTGVLVARVERLERVADVALG